MIFNKCMQRLFVCWLVGFGVFVFRCFCALFCGVFVFVCFQNRNDINVVYIFIN